MTANKNRQVRSNASTLGRSQAVPEGSSQPAALHSDGSRSSSLHGQQHHVHERLSDARNPNTTSPIATSRNKSFAVVVLSDPSVRSPHYQPAAVFLEGDSSQSSEMLEQPRVRKRPFDARSPNTNSTSATSTNTARKNARIVGEHPARDNPSARAPGGRTGKYTLGFDHSKEAGIALAFHWDKYPVDYATFLCDDNFDAQAIEKHRKKTVENKIKEFEKRF